MAIEISDELQDDRIELDPFDDAIGRGELFTNPDRTLALNKLIHLAPYSELLLLTGPRGVGRTVLAEQFVARAVDTWRTALVPVRESDLDTDLLLKIIDRLEMPLVTSDESRGILLDALARFLESLGRSGRRAIVVLDDAHNLSDEQLTMLGGLLEDYRTRNALSLVLVGPAGLERRLAAVPALASRLAHTLVLPPLDAADTGLYIRHRLENAGRGAEVARFTPEVVAEIHHQSGGLPLAINALARTVLHTHRIDKTRRPGRSGGEKRHRLPIAIAAAVAVVVLASQDRIGTLFTPVAPEGEAATGETMVQRAATSIDEIQPMPGEPLPPPPPAEIVEPLPVPAPEPPPPTSEVAALATAIGPPPPTVPTPERETPQREEVERAWLMAQPAGRYTLQLMALADESKVRRFIRRHAIAAESAVLPIERDGKRLYVLIYGSFPDRRAALDATLPAAWGISRPWPRTFESVRRDIATP